MPDLRSLSRIAMRGHPDNYGLDIQVNLAYFNNCFYNIFST
jgi:hypothetical protein